MVFSDVSYVLRPASRKSEVRSPRSSQSCAGVQLAHRHFTQPRSAKPELSPISVSPTSVGRGAPWSSSTLQKEIDKWVLGPYRPTKRKRTRSAHFETQDAGHRTQDDNAEIDQIKNTKIQKKLKIIQPQMEQWSLRDCPAFRGYVPERDGSRLKKATTPLHRPGQE